MPTTAALTPATDFRGNQVPAGDLPLFAAKAREVEKSVKYENLVRNMGCSFSPYVAETSGGLGPSCIRVHKLIKSYAHSRPAARLLRFIEEQACVRAAAYTRQVEETATTRRGGCIGPLAVDPTLSSEREASGALNPRAPLSQVALF
jgi:hypothetical protein